MTGEQIIAAYEQVLAIMQHMHHAAGSAEWDRLVELEHDCKAVVAGLAADGNGVSLGPALQRRKTEIIRQVLAEDAAIRSITEPWLAQLQGLLGTRRRERQLSTAYGATDGA